MKKRPITIIKDQEGGISYHQNFKQAASTYGWHPRKSDYALKTKGNHEGYTTEDMEMDVSIPCQYLRKLLLNGEKQSSTFNNEIEGNAEVVFTIGSERKFIIEAKVYNRNTAIEEHTFELSDRFFDKEYHATIGVINKVINKNGEIVKLDKTTEDILFEKLEL